MRNSVISMFLGVFALLGTAQTNATTTFPALEILAGTVTGTSSGVAMDGTAPFVLSDPSTILPGYNFSPDLVFSLTSDDTGAGFLSVTGSDDLSAGFSNLSIIHTFGGIAQVTADLNITGGSLAGVLGGTIGRLEGSLVNVGTFTPGQSLLGLDFSTASPNSTLKLSAVPVPAAVWLFGSGLLGLVGIARRKTRT